MMFVIRKDHPDALTSMANLPLNWKPLDHDAEAVNLLRNCLAKQKQTLGLPIRTLYPHSEALLE
jgi:hypothetical protein